MIKYTSAILPCLAVSADNGVPVPAFGICFEGLSVSSLQTFPYANGCTPAALGFREGFLSTEKRARATAVRDRVTE